MNGKKRFLTAFILGTGFIAALCAGCSYPIGSLLADPGLGVAENEIEVKKHKDQYYVGETFKPAEDFDLYVIFGGAEIRVEDIENSSVVIKIIGDPSAGNTVTISGKQQLQQGYVFKSAIPAKKSVDISLDGLKTSYNVLVEEKTGGNNAGIVINWPD
jgi:hypothetical protein